MSYDKALKMMEGVRLEEDDIFEPYSKLEYLEKLGLKKNPDGTITFKGILFDPRREASLVLSRRYVVQASTSIIRKDEVGSLPSKAKAFMRTAIVLSDKGVRWLHFYKLLALVTNGIFYGEGPTLHKSWQMIGTYKDKTIIFESDLFSVGYTAYLVWVGPTSTIDRAEKESRVSSMGTYAAEKYLYKQLGFGVWSPFSIVKEKLK